jgi:hypothetical protein
MNRVTHHIRTLVFLTVATAAASAFAADWPMWRFDEHRSAEWTGELADELHLNWVRTYPALEPAFQNARLQFDLGYEPVVKDGTLFVASSRNDSVTAVDTQTGEEKWRFYAEGPIRFAPVAWQSRLFFGADDGCVYCLNAADGSLVWKYRAVPSQRKLLGNERLISVWPVRGGPVIADGTLYFAAGVWSFEGVFVYALDADSGDVVWINDRTGFIYGQHPHDARAVGGLTPQGYLVVNGDELIVPCGTALPARFHRATGDLKHFELPNKGRSPGGWFTAAAKARRRGQELAPEDALLFDSQVNRDRHEGGWHEGPGQPGPRSKITLNGKELSFADGYQGIEGSVHSMLAADGKLFVVTLEGDIACFGPERVEPKVHADGEQPLDRPSDKWEATAKNILSNAGVEHGYALAWGIGTGRLIEELARQSELHVIAVDPDAEKCENLRRRLDAAGLLGTRIAVHHGDPLTFGFPPYLAGLVVSEDLPAAGFEKHNEFATHVFRSLRPFGGGACLQIPPESRTAFESTVRQAELAGAELNQTGDLTILRRPGALPGSTNYTDGWSSPDELVKAPLGVLWYDDKVSHFKRAPQPMIVDGVMISYDKDWKGWVDGDRPPYSLVPPTYSDIYTGRVFSQAEASALASSLPTRDIQAKQPDQYRHPSQKNAWKPEQPVLGTRINPLTGQREPRTVPKSYGCDGGIDYGSLFTMRSGTPAFYDKQVDSGVVHISGPRSGCTNSIIPAGGLLNVPYFYLGCTCSYPLPVGLALINMPAEYEQWAVWGPGKPESIHRVGVNFGAPGARMTQAGTLWLEHPRAGGPAPELKLTTVPASPDAYYRHSVWMEGGTGWPWVAASGAKRLTEVTLEGLKDGVYTVRLYFAEPEDKQPGDRIFDVMLQDRKVLQGFDIAKEAGGSMRAVVKEFSGVRTAGKLTLALTPQTGDPLLCGLEIIADGLDLDDLPTLEPSGTSARLSLRD